MSSAGLPFDLNSYDPLDKAAVYVVLKGYKPGCTNKLNKSHRAFRKLADYLTLGGEHCAQRMGFREPW